MKKKLDYIISGFEVYVDHKKKKGKFLVEVKFECNKQLPYDEIGEVVSRVLENSIKR